MDVDGDTTVGVVVPVDGDMDADGEAKDPECTRRAGGTSGPELRAAFLVRDGRGIILWGNKIKTKTKQATGKARPDNIIIYGSGPKEPEKDSPGQYNIHKQHLNSTVAWQTKKQCRRRVLRIML